MVTSDKETSETDHDLGMVFSVRGWYSPYWPLAMMSVLLFLYWIFAEALSVKLGKVFTKLNVGSNLDSVDEVLDNYW